MRRNNIHDVAKAAGVSIATVSRVINNNYPVDETTREKVNRAIRDIGYYPDAAARTMRGNNSFVIGYVVSDIANSHFTTIGGEIENIAGRHDYGMLVCSTNGDPKKEENYLRMLLSRKISALVINATGANDEFIARIAKTLPVILIYRQLHCSDFDGDYVGTDDFDGAYRLAKLALANGHRRIGLISGPSFLNTGSERREGFLAALNEAGVKLAPSLIFEGDFYSESGVRGAEKLLAGKARRPTLLAVMNNAMAMGVMSYLRSAGIAVPNDLSFLAFGDIHNRDLLYFQPTVLSQNPEEIGKVVGRLLLGRLANPQRTPERILVPGTLLNGDSLAKAAKK